MMNHVSFRFSSSYQSALAPLAGNSAHCQKNCETISILEAIVATVYINTCCAVCQVRQTVCDANCCDGGGPNNIKKYTLIFKNRPI